jgi:hypothetical protein
MTLRAKALLLRWGGFVVLAFVAFLATLASIFVSILIILAALYVVLLLLLRCPSCHKPVAWNPISGDPIDWLRGKKSHSWTLDIPKNCSRCGTSLE